MTAKENDSDSEIEDFTPDRDTNNLWTPQKYSGLTGPVTMNAANGSRKGSKSTKKTTKLAAVPDLNNVRFCRVCEDFLPVTEFPRGQRRYTCRVHLWERNGRKAKKTLLTKPRKKLLTRMWMQCYRDWACRDRDLLGYDCNNDRVGLTQGDINSLLDMETCLQRADGNSVTNSGEVNADAITELAVMPKDLSKPLSKENAMLVSKEERRQMRDKILRDAAHDPATTAVG